MTHPKTDRRIQRTRRQLHDALMTLILEKGYDAVTIADITSAADLGRTTFYLHYRDKEELLLESLEAIAAELREQVEKLTAQSLDGPIHQRPVAVVFNHAADHRTLYRIILKGEGGSKASSHIRELISAAAIDFFDRRMKGLISEDPNIPMEAVAGYFASALLGFMTWWLEKELPYSADQAAEMFTALFFQGARQIMGIPLEAAG